MDRFDLFIWSAIPMGSNKTAGISIKYRSKKYFSEVCILHIAKGLVGDLAKLQCFCDMFGSWEEGVVRGAQKHQ